MLLDDTVTVSLRFIYPEVLFWQTPDLSSRSGPSLPLGGIWAGAKPETGAEGASSLTRAVRRNMHATRARPFGRSQHAHCSLVARRPTHRLSFVLKERSWTTSATSAMMQAGVRWLGGCRAASWRTWANQEFPNDTQMAQDSVREVAFWPEPDLPSRRGPRPPLGGIWVGAKPGTGAEGASSHYSSGKAEYARNARYWLAHQAHCTLVARRPTHRLSFVLKAGGTFASTTHVFL